jgi:hypothetical protein
LGSRGLNARHNTADNKKHKPIGLCFFFLRARLDDVRATAGLDLGFDFHGVFLIVI